VLAVLLGNHLPGFISGSALLPADDELLFSLSSPAITAFSNSEPSSSVWKMNGKPNVFQKSMQQSTEEI